MEEKTGRGHVAVLDGDGWIQCASGHRHWGRFGAAGVLLRRVTPAGDQEIVLQHRAPWSHHGGTWGIPGGAKQSDETPIDAALREATEEVALPADAVRPVLTLVDDHGGWGYTTVVAQQVPHSGPLDPAIAGPETIDARWVPVTDVDALPLHPGFAAAWPALRLLPDPPTVIVDAANVIGSRPDGWWRDRPGAARRLRDQLVAVASAGLPAADWTDRIGLAVGSTAGSCRIRLGVVFPQFRMIVEGRAAVISADPRPLPAAVTVVPATGSGDDAVVDQATEAVKAGASALAITADRELARRVRAVGGAVEGPRWLLDQLVVDPR